MAFEEMIKKALDESRNNCRLGDTLEEVQEIQNYIKNAEKIYIPNKNGIKVDVLNKVLREYNLPSAKILQINTNEADSNRSPAFAKAIMALDVCDADLIIVRGRLGLLRFRITFTFCRQQRKNIDLRNITFPCNQSKNP